MSTEDNSPDRDVLLCWRRVHPLTWLVVLAVAGVMLWTGSFRGLLWGYFPRIGDSPVEFLMVAVSTLIVVEGYLRRPRKPWQFALDELLMLLAALAMVLSIVAPYQWKLQEWDQQMHAERLPVPLVDSSWPVRIPLLFGLLCEAYAALWAAIWMAEFTYGWMKENWWSGKDPSGDEGPAGDAEDEQNPLNKGNMP